MDTDVKADMQMIFNLFLLSQNQSKIITPINHLIDKDYGIQ